LFVEFFCKGVMTSVVLQLYATVRNNLFAVTAAVFLVAVLSKLLPAFLKQWRVYLAFRNIPCIPEQHFLFGHAPE